MRTAEERREALKAVYREASGCTRCPQLAATRHSVVFGSGNADADLMFVGEAPGQKEDEQGLPFVGQAGRLLSRLLEEIGLRREDAFIANTLKCLSHDAMVQLGDGSWERIGRLVRARYAGTVMAVDAGGRLVARRVTGWHETPLGGRRVFRLTYASAPGEVRLTGDHPVLTERGYVRADQLRDEDRVATGAGAPGPAATLYAAVRVEDVTDRHGAERTFCCIDVEETHNFVTAGGVVHNCRPPGNRDPLPQEIQNCQGYLWAQLELIQPTVVCTLGNYATKLLRGDPTGITRLHGQPEVRTLGPRTVRLYPLYHPAAALYTPSMLEVLRADFARIPELLALGPPEQPAPPAPAPPEPEAPPAPAAEAPPEPLPGQLDLF